MCHHQPYDSLVYTTLPAVYWSSVLRAKPGVNANAMRPDSAMSLLWSQKTLCWRGYWNVIDCYCIYFISSCMFSLRWLELFVIICLGLSLAHPKPMQKCSRLTQAPYIQVQTELFMNVLLHSSSSCSSAAYGRLSEGDKVLVVTS